MWWEFFLALLGGWIVRRRLTRRGAHRPRLLEMADRLALPAEEARARGLIPARSWCRRRCAEAGLCEAPTACEAPRADTCRHGYHACNECGWGGW